MGFYQLDKFKFYDKFVFLYFKNQLNFHSFYT